MGWKHYKELIVWQKSMDLVESVYTLTKLLPSDERFSLTDQMRRAVVSIPPTSQKVMDDKRKKNTNNFCQLPKDLFRKLKRNY